MPAKQLSATAAALLALVQGAQAQLFTVNCAPVAVERLDPVVFPGIISPHVHAVVGSTNFQRTEPNSVAIAGNATTCDKLLDHSNYWQPQLYHLRTDGMFDMVTFQGNVSSKQPTHRREGFGLPTNLLNAVRRRTTSLVHVTTRLAAKIVMALPLPLLPQRVSGWWLEALY